jgi:hypothetical protein
MSRNKLPPAKKNLFALSRYDIYMATSVARYRLPKARLERLRQTHDGLYLDRVKGNRVAVELVEPYDELREYEEKGFALPMGAKEKYSAMPSGGVIIAVGDGVDDPDLQPGAMVAFSRFGGSDWNGGKGMEVFRVLDASEVLFTWRAGEDKNLADVIETGDFRA